MRTKKSPRGMQEPETALEAVIEFSESARNRRSSATD